MCACTVYAHTQQIFTDSVHREKYPLYGIVLSPTTHTHSLHCTNPSLIERTMLGKTTPEWSGVLRLGYPYGGPSLHFERNLLLLHTRHQPVPSGEDNVVSVPQGSQSGRDGLPRLSAHDYCILFTCFIYQACSIQCLVY